MITNLFQHVKEKSIGQQRSQKCVSITHSIKQSI